MNWRPTTHRRALTATLVVLLGGSAGLASDHQDTQFTELNPKSDLTVVYAFPGATTGRIVPVDTRAFLTPAGAR